VGVGAFIVSNAIVSPEARNVGKASGGWWSSVFKSIRSSSPLLVLGLARFLAVKSTDYQEHVSEYGVHWNFFITLFVVRVSNQTTLQQILHFAVFEGYRMVKTRLCETPR